MYDLGGHRRKGKSGLRWSAFHLPYMVFTSYKYPPSPDTLRKASSSNLEHVFTIASAAGQPGEKKMSARKLARAVQAQSPMSCDSDCSQRLHMELLNSPHRRGQLRFDDPNRPCHGRRVGQRHSSFGEQVGIVQT